MSHEIDVSTGTAAVFVTGEAAWHELGQTVDSALTSVDAIKMGGLDWLVEKWPLRAFKTIDGVLTERTVPGAYATVRTDTQATLGLVGDKYRIFQNREAFDFMDALVADKLAMYETAGSLFGGKRVWMLARIPKEYRVGNDDMIKPYVLLTNTHDGTTSVRMIPTTVRVVCNNTLNLALKEGKGEGLSIWHSESLDKRIKEARLKFGIITARFDKFDEELHTMIAKQLTVEQSETYFKAMAGVEENPKSDNQKKRREKVFGQMVANFDNERNTLAGIAHSAWGAYNSVSEWADHQRNYRGTGIERANNRLNSVWFGQSNDLKQFAYGKALELAVS